MKYVWILASLVGLTLPGPSPLLSAQLVSAQPLETPSAPPPPPPIQDGNPVGPFHYMGIVNSQAQASTAAGPCLASGTCQIDAVLTADSGALPGPTCPPSQQCLAFNSASMTNVTLNGSDEVSGIIVVSSSVLPPLTGVPAGAYGIISNYVKGAAATLWQHPFAACRLGTGQCQIDLYIATTLPATTVTTAAVPTCSPSAQECLSFNGSPMHSVQDNETVGAAITIDMP